MQSSNAPNQLGEHLPEYPHVDELLTDARKAFQNDEWIEAERLCNLVVERSPDTFAALNLLGMIAAQTHRLQDAVTLFAKAISIDPSRAEPFGNLGNVLHTLGSLDAALDSYSNALRIQPENVRLLFYAGTVAHDLGKPELALEYFDRALKIDPNDTDIHYRRAVALQKLRRHEEALADLQQVLSVNPQHADALAGRGIALQNLGFHREALESLDQALRLHPDNPEILNARANSLTALEDTNNAIETYRRALAIGPRHVDALSNLGGALHRENRLIEALDCINCALAIDAHHVEALYNGGVVLNALVRPKEALTFFERAQSIDPNHIGSHWNSALSNLRLGWFEPGWIEYEWRWKEEQLKSFTRNFSKPIWLGNEPLVGKTILLHGEAGFGDRMQFCRYAKLVSERGATTLLEVPSSLRVLLNSLSGVAQILTLGQALPDFDYHCPLMSLPLAFKTELSTIPADIPYLFAEPARVAVWLNKLGPKRKPRLGLVWCGNPRHRNDLNRSLPLQTLLSLVDEKVEWISLQKDIREMDAELLKSRTDILQFDDQLSDFADTAALVEHLDVVVTVDTSVAHLAGAMGKPVWILLPFDSEWRWLMEREDSPWYPTARLFRQPKAGDWQSVIERVREAIAREFSEAEPKMVVGSSKASAQGKRASTTRPDRVSGDNKAAGGQPAYLSRTSIYAVIAIIFALLCYIALK